MWTINHYQDMESNLTTSSGGCSEHGYGPSGSISMTTLTTTRFSINAIILRTYLKYDVVLPSRSVYIWDETETMFYI